MIYTLEQALLLGLNWHRLFLGHNDLALALLMEELTGNPLPLHQDMGWKHPLLPADIRWRALFVVVCPRALSFYRFFYLVFRGGSIVLRNRLHDVVDHGRGSRLYVFKSHQLFFAG